MTTLHATIFVSFSWCVVVQPKAFFSLLPLHFEGWVGNKMVCQRLTECWNLDWVDDRVEDGTDSRA
jgi:hypothetical protein